MTQTTRAERPRLAEAEQLNLFGGIDMAKLREKVVAMTARRAPETARAYASALRSFEAWCQMAGRPYLPTTSDTVAMYAAYCIGVELLSLATVEQRFAAIAGAHRAIGAKSPCNEDCRAVLSGARRTGAGRVSVGKKALTVAELKACVRKLPKSPGGVRDRAILLLGFASGLRRSELSALDLDDIAVTAKGVRVTVRRSKTDQMRNGREIGVFAGRHKQTCPLQAVKNWLFVRGREDGPLFSRTDQAGQLTGERLSGDGIYEVVKRSIAAIGLDPALYGAHSLRAGCVTAAAEAGVPESLIMQRTGHKSIAMVAKYVRPAQIWSFDPLAKAL